MGYSVNRETDKRETDKRGIQLIGTKFWKQISI